MTSPTTDSATMELSKRYEPHAVEARWSAAWTDGQHFVANPEDPRPTYSVVIPPPNVTGVLHMGHALNNTLQDILVRYKRMSGFNTLWVPGTDHAGIATQNVVERSIAKEGLTRHDLGRDAFIERVWKWKEEHGATIRRQLERLGCSCDWTRERFTMDEGLSRAVRAVFFRLYHEDLIYRGTYMVNWCPRCQTTLADDEVEYSDRSAYLYHLRYPLQDDPTKFAVVATTRPETMLGDTAVAVHPDDERYRDWIGRHVVLPLVERPIPVIADDFVDPQFGTGMVKITPAHDPNDFAAGKRHNLEEISVLTPDGRINTNGGRFEGLDRMEARKRIVADLEQAGLMDRIVDHPQRAGECYRCHTVIEPTISLQWFVKVGPLAVPAREAVADGTVRFHPEARRADYFRWLDNLRDWAISRQLWWGHQIPAFYDADGNVIVPRTEDEYQALHQEARHPESSPRQLRQDADVLDTWFSSALWPFSTLGWPDETPDLAKYYPTSCLVTAKDIIFFWVARMIMMGLHFQGGRAPFRDVCFNPIVGDEHGKKMSKSKGNAIDPLVLADEYGTDALRFTLCAYASRDQHIAFNVKECEGYRNFMNKLWNAARLVFSLTEDLTAEDLSTAWPLDGSLPEDAPLEVRWIRARFARVAATSTSALDSFEFDAIARSLYDFLWKDYCDYFLELAKSRIYAAKGEDARRPGIVQLKATLALLLGDCLRLLHPICPFITEELFAALRASLPGLESARQAPTCGSSLVEALRAPVLALAPAVAPLPAAFADDKAEAEFARLQEILYTVRNIRGEMAIPPGMKANVHLVCADSALLSLIQANTRFFETLTRIGTLHASGEPVQLPFAATGVCGPVTIHVELPAELREQEVERLRKEQENLTQNRARIEAKLANESFTSRAPADLVAKERAKLDQADRELGEIRTRLQHLEAK